MNSPRKKSDKLSRPRLVDSKPSHSSNDSLSNKRGNFEDSGLASIESGSTIVKCVTPTHSIREMARMYSLPNSKTPSPRLQRGSSFSSRSAKSDSTAHSANQPVRLQVNYDDDVCLFSYVIFELTNLLFRQKIQKLSKKLSKQGHAKPVTVVMVARAAIQLLQIFHTVW